MPENQPISPNPAPVAASPISKIEKLPSAGRQYLSKTDMFSKFLILEGWSHWFFRLGFASIFLVNAISAAVDPKSFTSLLESNPVASSIGFLDIMVKIALINDLLLFVFIVGGWRKQMVYAWAGLWLIMVAGIKLMNLLFS